MGRRSEPQSRLEDWRELVEVAERLIMGLDQGADWQRLEQLLQQPELRRRYLEFMLVHAELGIPQGSEHAKGVERATLKHPVFKFDRATGWSRHRGWAAAAAAGLLLAGLWAAWQWQASSRTVAVERPQVERPARVDREQVQALPERRYLPYDRRDLPINQVAYLGSAKDESISARTLRIERGAELLTARSGATVEIDGPAMFGASSEAGGVLYAGQVTARGSDSQSNYAIQTAELSIGQPGSEFRVSIQEPDRVRIDGLSGEVAVAARIREPVFHWSFDGLADKPAATGFGDLRWHEVELVTGLIGAGALRFSNRGSEHALITRGTGPEVGSGEFACGSGITIEVLVASNWSGAEGDYDEIFRKEDGNYRMLLSFQNDRDTFGYSVPPFAGGPCLAFGLHLEGLGYSELELPLDGQGGRPALAQIADGRPHHLAVTYDSFSGRKAIFVDGKLAVSHDFPRGTMILNGGPAHAEIGNHWGGEPFSGTIDELSFYDFALTFSEIAEHASLASRGVAWAVDTSPAASRARWRMVARIQAGGSQFVNSRTGLPKQP